MIRERVDLMAYDVQGRPTLAVEVKNKRGTSRAWAAQLRRNMLAHGQLPETAFFLLALPDRFYLWKNTSNQLSNIEPTYEIDPTHPCCSLTTNELGLYQGN
jgi:hypothetical protein